MSYKVVRLNGKIVAFGPSDDNYEPVVPDGAVVVIEDHAPSLQPPTSIPQSVSRFQARAALHLAGLLETVEAMMAAPETPALAKLAWADAQEFKRNSPTVLSLSASLGLTEAQLDDLFTTAAGIDA